MKWSKDYVQSKIIEIVPHQEFSKQSLPEALKDAAVELFLKDEGFHNGSYRAYVIMVALKELRKDGYLSFGSVNEDWA